MAKDLGYNHKHAPKQDLRTLLSERDNQNAFLRAQLHARIERTAHLETRLLSTLDTLDELQAAAARDLQEAQQENARLTRRLDICEAVAREADREKSDMTNAVLQLVAKVESCNDYSKWRASRIEFSHDITIYPQRYGKHSRFNLPSGDEEGCSCAKAYVPAVVEELSDTLARERQTHALTVEEAEQRLVLLQSRVAVREAEIARWAAMCQCAPALNGGTGQLELLSEKEQEIIEDCTADRERVLEEEVFLLEKKLERERHRRRAATRIEQSVQTESPKYYPPPRPSDPIIPDVFTSDDPSFDQDDPGDFDAVPAALTSLDSQISQLRKGLTDLTKEKETLRRILSDGLDAPDVPESVLSKRKQHNKPLESAEGAVNQNTDDRNRDGLRDVLLLEEECIRLIRSESALRAEVERLKSREALLSDENARLKAEVSELSISHNDLDKSLSPASFDLSAVDLAFPPLEPVAIPSANTSAALSGDQGESISDLLLHQPERTQSGSSSSASSPSELATPTEIVDPSDVPLPITPTFEDAEGEEEEEEELRGPISPPLSSEPSPPPAPRSPETISPGDSRDMDALAHELAEARAEAEMHERDIAEVRNLMEDLVSRVAADLQDSNINGT